MRLWMEWPSALKFTYADEWDWASPLLLNLPFSESWKKGRHGKKVTDGNHFQGQIEDTLPVTSIFCFVPFSAKQGCGQSWISKNDIFIAELISILQNEDSNYLWHMSTLDSLTVLQHPRGQLMRHCLNCIYYDTYVVSERFSDFILRASLFTSFSNC